MNLSERPTITRQGEDAIHEHPSFGVIRISNPNGTRRLFGSDAEHSSFIQLEIAPAKLKRGLNYDQICSTIRPIISVSMSHAQYVSMIQSCGKGEGTPCTIEYGPKSLSEDIVRFPTIEHIQSKTDLIKDEIQKDVKAALDMSHLAVMKLQEQLEKLKAKKSITKADISSLQSLANVAQNKLEVTPRNIKYALTCAEETIDRAVQSAKIEIDASVEYKLRQIGLEAVSQDPVLDLSSALSVLDVSQLADLQPNE